MANNDSTAEDTGGEAATIFFRPSGARTALWSAFLTPRISRGQIAIDLELRAKATNWPDTDYPARKFLEGRRPGARRTASTSIRRALLSSSCFFTIFQMAIVST